LLFREVILRRDSAPAPIDAWPRRRAETEAVCVRERGETGALIKPTRFGTACPWI
jgi:hypothetical protein